MKKMNVPDLKRLITLCAKNINSPEIGVILTAMIKDPNVQQRMQNALTFVEAVDYKNR